MSEYIPAPRSSTEMLDKLTGLIGYWQKRFDEVAADDPACDLRSQATEELDPLWPYGDMECIVYGIGQRVEQSAESTIITEGIVENERGRSLGLTVVRFGKAGQQQRWIVSYMFEQGYVDMGDEASTGFLYLESSRAVILPEDEINSCFEGIYQPQATLDERSQQLANAINDPLFFTLSADEQKYFIDREIRRAEKQADGWGGIKGRPVYLNAERAFVLGPNSHTPFLEIELLDQELSGICQGLGVLARRQVASGKALRNEEQLIDSAAGLFLIVKADAAVAAMYDVMGKNDHHFYVPISSQDVGLSFLETADVE